MPKFRVDIFENSLYSVEVMADDEEAARASALRAASGTITATTREAQAVILIGKALGRPKGVNGVTTNGHGHVSAISDDDLVCTEPGCTKPGPHRSVAGLAVHKRRAHGIQSQSKAAVWQRSKKTGKRSGKQRAPMSEERRAILAANAVKARAAKAAKAAKATRGRGRPPKVASGGSQEERFLAAITGRQLNVDEIMVAIGTTSRQAVHTLGNRTVASGTAKRVAPGVYTGGPTIPAQVEQALAGGNAMRANELAELLDVGKGTMRSTLTQLTNKGRIRRVGEGLYSAAQPS